MDACDMPSLGPCGGVWPVFFLFLVSTDHGPKARSKISWSETQGTLLSPFSALAAMTIGPVGEKERKEEKKEEKCESTKKMPSFSLWYTHTSKL